MPLTDQERVELTAELSQLQKKRDKIQIDVDRTFKSVIIFLIIGIFIFPCLVVALICFLLMKWGQGQIKDIESQISLINSKL